MPFPEALHSSFPISFLSETKTICLAMGGGSSIWKLLEPNFSLWPFLSDIFVQRDFLLFTFQGQHSQHQILK